MTSESLERQLQQYHVEVEQLRDEVRQAQNALAEFRNTPGFPTDGRQFALKFPMLILGPQGERYSLVRVAGGHLAVVAAPAHLADWSNA